MLLLDSIVDRLEINPNKHAATIKPITLNTFKICCFNEKRSRYNDIIEWKKYYICGRNASPYICIYIFFIYIFFVFLFFTSKFCMCTFFTIVFENDSF